MNLFIKSMHVISNLLALVSVSINQAILTLAWIDQNMIQKVLGLEWLISSY